MGTLGAHVLADLVEELFSELAFVVRLKDLGARCGLRLKASRMVHLRLGLWQMIAARAP